MSVSMPQYFNIPAFSKACIVFSGAIILAPLCAKKLTLLYTLGTLNCVALSALYDSNSTDNGLFTELTSSTIGPSLSAVLFNAQLTPLLSLIHISEPTRLGMISYAVFCLKKKKKKQ